MREQKDWEIYTHSHNNVMMGFFWDLTTKPSAELDLSITSTTIYLIRSTSKANIGLILYIMKTILPMTILVYLLLSQDYRPNQISLESIHFKNILLFFTDIIIYFIHRLITFVEEFDLKAKFIILRPWSSMLLLLQTLNSSTNHQEDSWKYFPKPEEDEIRLLLLLHSQKIL